MCASTSKRALAPLARRLHNLNHDKLLYSHDIPSTLMKPHTTAYTTQSLGGLACLHRDDKRLHALGVVQ